MYCKCFILSDLHIFHAQFGTYSLTVIVILNILCDMPQIGTLLTGTSLCKKSTDCIRSNFERNLIFHCKETKQKHDHLLFISKM